MDQLHGLMVPLWFRLVKRTGWVLLTCVVLIGAGCSDDTPAVPDGYTMLERDEYSFAYPNDWEITDDQPKGVAVTGPDSLDNVFETVIIKVDEEAYGDFDAQVLAITEPFRLFEVDGYEELDNQSIEVPGASNATIVDAQYDTELTGGKIRQRMIFATAGPDDPLLFIDIAAPEEVFDAQIAEQVTSTLAVR